MSPWKQEPIPECFEDRLKLNIGDGLLVLNAIKGPKRLIKLQKPVLKRVGICGTGSGHDGEKIKTLSKNPEPIKTSWVSEGPEDENKAGWIFGSWFRTAMKF